MHLRFLLGRVAVLALLVAGALLGIRGCGAEWPSPEASALRGQFPDQAAQVLYGPRAFVAAAPGFSAPPQEEDERFGLPRRGEGAIRFGLEGGFEVRAREVGASGEGALEGRAVAYAREGGTSFWAATEEGYEEWLMLEPRAVKRDEAVAAWEVEGASLRLRGDGVELCDARGEARVRVTAPAAYAAGGRPVETRLLAREGKIELWIDADREAVLVDPGWRIVGRRSKSRRSGHTATRLPSGRVLVAGGSTPVDRGARSLANASVFDPTPRGFSPVGAMLVPRAGHTATPLEGDGQVLVAGGMDSAEHAVADAELYVDDPVSPGFSLVGPMAVARARHTATRLPGGQVLVTGGHGSDGKALKSVEIYDPATKGWTPAKDLNAARAEHTATLLPSGEVLVAGGDDGNGAALASAELFDPTTGAWTLAYEMRVARRSHAVTLLGDGRVLVTGGLSDGDEVLIGAELYDPAKDRWVVAGDMSAARAEHTATLLPSGKVLVAGGVEGNGTTVASAALYDPASDRWETAGTMSTPRARHAATELADGKVLLIGGDRDNVGAADSPGGGAEPISAEIYDPPADLWASAAAMLVARENHTATRLPGGQVLVTGGHGSDDKALKSAEIYDPATKGWTPAKDMPAARAHHTATLLPSGQVLVAGGDTSDETLDSAALYDPETHTWAPAPSMGAAHAEHTATLLPSGKVLVAGGDGFFDSSSTAELFDPENHTWTPTGGMNAQRASHTATLLPSGKVLVAGGDHGPSTAPSSAELYDPETNTWTLTEDMNAAHAYHTATLLPSGEVLVAGGEAPGMPNAELYDAKTGSWAPAAQMSTARAHHTATLLPNGKLLVAGGSGDPPGASLASMELYDPTTDTWLLAGEMLVPRGSFTATDLSHGEVLMAGGTGEDRAELLRLLDSGAPCAVAGLCQTGSCSDNVCCDRACDDELCGTCAVAATFDDSLAGGEVSTDADGICQKSGESCSPYLCSADKSCRTRCESVRDCAPGFACDPAEKCILVSLPSRSEEYAECNLAAPPRASSAGTTREGSMEPSLLFLAALCTLRRQASRRSSRRRRRADGGGGRASLGGRAAGCNPCSLADVAYPRRGR